jgi:hypothetical protein
MMLHPSGRKRPRIWIHILCSKVLGRALWIPLRGGALTLVTLTAEMYQSCVGAVLFRLPHCSLLAIGAGN